MSQNQQARRELPLHRIVEVSKGRKLAETDHIANGSAMYRYIQIDDLRPGGRHKFTEDAHGVFVTENDLIIVWDGANAGTVGYGLSGAIGSTLARLRITDPNVDTRYLGQYLRSQFHRIQASTTGATIPHVNRSSLDSICIPLLPLNEQRRVATILERAEALLQKRLAVIQQASHLIESSFAHYFGDALLNQRGFPTAPLESLAGRIVDCPHSTPDYAVSPTRYYCVRSSDIQDGIVDLNQTRYVTEETYRVRIERHRPVPGEVIFTREGGRLGNAAQIPPDTQMCLGQRMMLFTAKTGVSTNEFIWALLNSPGIQHQIRLLTAGAAAPRINISDIRQFRVIVPPIELQQRFSAFVLEMRNQATNLTQSRKEIENLLNSLVQRAFRGEL
jgi:type I restriction enzyme S subunit